MRIYCIRENLKRDGDGTDAFILLGIALGVALTLCILQFTR